MNSVVSKIGAARAAGQFLAGLLVASALVACGGPESVPEEELREWVATAQAAAEAKQRRAMLNMISSAYSDENGFDRDDVDEVLRVYFFRQNNISLLTSIKDVRVFDGTAAEIDMTVGMAGTNDGVLGISADAYNFQLELVKDDDDWLLISAHWSELGG